MQEALEEQLTSFLMTTRLNNRESAHPAIFMYNRITSARMNAANIFSLEPAATACNWNSWKNLGTPPTQNAGSSGKSVLEQTINKAITSS
jgi:hypothetical protein